MTTPPQQQNKDTLNFGYELMKAVKTLQVCAVSMNDANQALPYESDMKCSDGTCTSDVYHGVAVMIERVADDLNKVWQAV